MRRLLASLVLALVLAPAAHAAGWGAPVAIPQSNLDPDVGGVWFGPENRGLLWWETSPGLHRVAASADGGASWGAPTSPLAIEDLEIGADAAGDRVFAWSGGGFVRIQRGGSAAVPGAGYAQLAVPGGPDEISLAVQGNGDALVAWSGGASSNGTAGAAFWPAGAALPNAGQELLRSANGASHPLAVLDPDRRAVVSFRMAFRRWQATAADASQPTPFGAATDLGDGGGAIGGQAADGRALLAVTEIVLTPDRRSTDYQRVAVATRAPGGTFAGFAPLQGSQTDSVRFALNPRQVLVAPTGDALVAWDTWPMTLPPGSCADNLPAYKAWAAVGRLGAGGGAGLAPATLHGGTTQGDEPWGAVGADGRRALVFDEIVRCTAGGVLDLPISRPLFAASGTPALIAAPPAELEAMAFRGDGQLYGIYNTGTPSFSLAGVLYDTGVPLTPPGPPAPGPPGPSAPGPGPAPGPVPRGPVVTIPVVPSSVTVTARAVEVVVRVVEPGDITLDLLARGSGLVRASAAARRGRRRGARRARPVLVGTARRRLARAGTVTIAIRLTRRGRSTLASRRRLAITLRTTFRPLSGGRAVVSSRAYTLRPPRAR